jgi:hypothetical protein
MSINVTRYELDPQFDTKLQAFAFTLLMITLLALPVLMWKFRLVSRHDVYPAVPTTVGAYTYIQNQIFEEKSDIDILFLSTSLLWDAIDTPYVQKELSRKLGREANVITFGTNWRSEGLYYLLLRDVLQHRKVKLLAFSMPTAWQESSLPQKQSFRWLIYGEDERPFDGLPWRSRLSIYGEKVLGAPRHVLSKLRSNHLETSPLTATFGADLDPGGGRGEGWDPKLPDIPTSRMIYSDGNRDVFEFSNDPLNHYQNHFLQLLFEKARENAIPVMIVHVPLTEERHATKVIKRMYWPAVFGGDVSIVGVPPATLFGGMSNAEIDQLYFRENKDHLNRKGSQLFTRTITPAILKVYEDHLLQQR